MSIKRYIATKDNTISAVFRENLTSRSLKANLGGSDILEVFSIYGQATSSSLEMTRILSEFPVASISKDRTNNILPASGSVNFKLKFFNSEHGQTTPKNYQIIAHPVLQDWTEGDGLDMESYLNTEASNWLSASTGTVWHSTGSDYGKSSFITSSIPMEHTQTLAVGTEDLNIDVTGLVEEWIKYYQGGAGITAATGVITFNANPVPADDPTLTIRSHEGQEFKYIFLASGTAAYAVGNTWHLGLEETAAETATALKARIDLDFGSKIETSIDDKTITMTQSAKGLHGNTNISSNIAVGVSGVDTTDFTGGTAMPNYGVVIKLAEEYENGSKKRSYYTKKFLARGSHEYLRRPAIEAQWDNSIKDDRNYVAKSSSLAPASECLNTVFLYNKRRGSFYDLPNTGSALVVSLHAAPSPVSTGEQLVASAGGTSIANTRFTTASRHSIGIYKASFAYTGSQTFVYDVWAKSTTGIATTLATGSGFTIYNELHDNSYEMPSYNFNITNLKDSYLKEERTTFRIYTRRKNWQPNIYTKASQKAPIDNVRSLFYKITKVYDNYEIISYSTGSNPSFSSVSYDKQGSFFDLDMKLLEPNNSYEISFLLQDGPNYLEQPEKFRFRVSP